MRKIIKFSIVIISVICVLSCTNKKETLDGISQAIYDSANHDHEMKREPGPYLPPEHKPPTYDQYLRAPKKEIGKSNAFILSRNERAIIKLDEYDYLVIEVAESNHEDGEDTFSEACSLIWTLVKKNGAKAGKATGYIRYEKKEISERKYNVTKIAGTDRIILGEGYSIQWSYSSKKGVYLYPETGTLYTVVKIEP